VSDTEFVNCPRVTKVQIFVHSALRNFKQSRGFLPHRAVPDTALLEPRRPVPDTG